MEQTEEMKQTMEDVKAFHAAFDLPIGNFPHAGGSNISPAARQDLYSLTMRMEALARDLLRAHGRHGGDTLLLRLHLCQEELSELSRAIYEGDTVEALDALCDMRYVADGAAVELGMTEVFQEAFDEVHRSNMSKLENGRPVLVNGRISKGPSYKKPELRRFVFSAT